MRTLLQLALALVLLVAGNRLAAEPAFVHLAEGFTSRDKQTGIVAAQRLFSAPDLAEICATVQAPERLIVVAPEPLQLVQGQWFDYERLIVLAVGSAGTVLAPIPIAVEVEEITPPLLDLRADMTGDPGDKVLPIRDGAFRFRFRAICEGHPAFAIAGADVVARRP